MFASWNAEFKWDLYGRCIFPIVSPMQKENRSSLFLKENQNKRGKNLSCKEETSIKAKPLPFYTFQSILVIFKKYFLNSEITISHKHVFPDSWNVKISKSEHFIFILPCYILCCWVYKYFHNILELLFTKVALILKGLLCFPGELCSQMAQKQMLDFVFYWQTARDGHLNEQSALTSNAKLIFTVCSRLFTHICEGRHPRGQGSIGNSAGFYVWGQPWLCAESWGPRQSAVVCWWVTWKKNPNLGAPHIMGVQPQHWITQLLYHRLKHD